MLLSVDEWTLELGFFFQSGGWVLFAILALTILMFLILAERFLYLAVAHKHAKSDLCLAIDRGQSWQSILSLICDTQIQLNTSMTLLKTVISLCPLMGLLGTVTGMIQLFDSLAIYGTANPRLMASGVASATFPTMTGMAIAVIGLVFHGRLQRMIIAENRFLQKHKQALSPRV